MKNLDTNNIGNNPYLVLCLGWLGVHKFLKKQIGLGILYLFTCGLFGFGWIYDTVISFMSYPKTSEVFKPSRSDWQSEMVDAINAGVLPQINTTDIILQEGEICHFIGVAYTYKDKTYTSGYDTIKSGGSVRLAKSLSYRTGGSNTRAIKQTERTYNTGLLFLTNQRIIFSGESECFEKPLNKLTSVRDSTQSVLIQSGNKCLNIFTKHHLEFVTAFNMVVNNTK